MNLCLNHRESHELTQFARVIFTGNITLALVAFIKWYKRLQQRGPQCQLKLKTQPCHETFLGLTATFDFGRPNQRYLRFRAGMEVSHYKAVLCYFLIWKSHVFRLYFCAHSGFEDAYFATHPRRSGPVNVNSAQFCGALEKFSQCEEETDCKEMAKGLLYTTASVST